MKLRHLAATLLIPLAMAGTGPAAADNYPSRPLRLLVGFPPGGGTDVLARALAVDLGKAIGQTVVVENRGGANGVIATAELAKAEPDGYTLMMTISSHVTNSLLYPKLPYDTFKDFAPISLVATSPFVLVAHPSFQANTVQDLIAMAKAKPGFYNYASPGNGSTQHLSLALMNLMANIDMVHVAYKGGAPALNDLIAGQVPLMFVTTVQSLPFLQQHRLKALAISSDKRASVLPEVPTIAESGVPGYASDVWFGVIAPAATPKPVIDKLNKEIVKIFRTPEMKQKLATQGAEPIASTPEAFAKVINDESVKFADLFKKTGIKAE
jgi:tripartite-type tricarboxylate transporter receptor subunit TctC